uniref:Nuclease HARBI1 n=1 Tax=Erpetoichthys calabaricus TaxID=27687 RepID=A0A8C4S7F7_ERPCA
MASLFMNEQPIDIGVQIMRKEFHIERVLRDQQDPLLLPEEILFERCYLLGPCIRSQTRRSRALTATQTVCIALSFFASGNAENLSKSAACQAIRKVCLALKNFLRVFIVFPGHLCVQTIKEVFHAIAGFPNVIGALDCIQTQIKAPSGTNEGDYMKCAIHSLMICATSLSDHVSSIGHLTQFLMTSFSKPNPVCNIIVAYSILYNIATIRKERGPELVVQPDDDLEPLHLDQPSGKAARDMFITQKLFTSFQATSGRE